MCTSAQVAINIYFLCIGLDHICPDDMTFEQNNDDNKCHFEGYQALPKRPKWRKVGKFTKIYKGWFFSSQLQN